MTYVFRTPGENFKALAIKEFGDAIKKPSHYQGRHGMEAIDVVKNFGACPEYEEGFYWGNAVKYLLRYHAKNGLEDLKKARKNLDWLIEKLEVNDDNG
ncbi:hypothetical protein Javan157_0035 [Streptococcus phage Javan157]|nr:hypothetical protein Javan157_0035 [Streptococcus phage Javan157]